MITLFLFITMTTALIVFEVAMSLDKERKGISLTPMWFLRSLVGLLVCSVYHIELSFNLSDTLVFGLFFGSFYWTFFDGMRNVSEGVNWFKWGETKIIDKFFGQHPGLQMAGHFIKWSLMIGSFLNSAWLHIYTP